MGSGTKALRSSGCAHLGQQGAPSAQREEPRPMAQARPEDYCWWLALAPETSLWQAPIFGKAGESTALTDEKQEETVTQGRSRRGAMGDP